MKQQLIVTEEELKQLLTKQSLNEISIFLGLSKYKILKLISLYNLNDFYLTSFANSRTEYYDTYFIKQGTMYKLDDIRFYYIDQNHSKKETSCKFKLEMSFLTRIFKKYNIVKPYGLAIKIRNNSIKNKYHTINYNATEECKNKIKQTCLSKYGVSNYAKLPEYIDKKRNTCLIKYSDPCYQNRKQIKQSLQEHYGVDSIAALNRLDAIKDKKRKTNIKNRGVEYPLQSPAVMAIFNVNRQKIVDKNFATRLKNHTVNTSKAEERVYNYLISLFGKDDIIRQYKNYLYPYHCDFYIKSEDLYIELNLFFTHGYHPFNSIDNKDIVLLSKWYNKSLQSNFYKNAIDVWTNVDVKKQETAKNNKLNYIASYSEEALYKYLNNHKKGEKQYEIIL
jgi:hypothetical protein